MPNFGGILLNPETKTDKNQNGDAGGIPHSRTVAALAPRGQGESDLSRSSHEALRLREGIIERHAGEEAECVELRQLRATQRQR